MLWNFWSDNFKAAWGSARGKIEFVMFCASLLYFFSADWVGDVNWAKVLAWLFVAVFMFEWILIAPFKRYQAMQKQRDDASKLLADTLSSSLPRIAVKKALAQFMEGSG